MSTATSDLPVRRLMPEHLDAETFAVYGSVVGPESATSPNLNRAPGNLGFLWIQRSLEFPRQPYLGCVRYYYRATRCEFLQKHPASTVVLIPLGLHTSVIYVAVDNGRDQPDPNSMRAFLLEGGAGIILNPGTWVRYAYPFGEFADYAYITQRIDPATANTTDDVVRCRLDEDLGFVLDIEFVAPTGMELGVGGAVVAGPPRNPPHD